DLVNGESMDDDSFILSITVADTGSGIADENFEKIFDSFDRLGGKNKVMVEGTGLGLSITRNLVEMMNGTIDVKSVLGSGSVFSVKIPQKISGDKMIGIFSFVPEKKIKKSFSVEGAKVLAVDDNRMNLAVLSGLLKKYGIIPDIALSGEECLTLCETSKYDLILMDHMMPSPDGIETMHKLRDENPLNKETAIVVLTANAVSGAKKKYLDEGFDDYLSKPVETNFLEQVLLKHIPEEMITEFSEEEKSDDSLSDITDSDTNEIDKNIGLKYCGSNEELYNEIVESYCTEGRKYREKLITCIENDDMQNYAIIAHTLKSTSLNIGAKRFSDFAKEHELAAKQNDNEKIKESFDDFLIQLDKVISEAETMLGISHEEVSEPRYNEVSNEKYRYMLSELYNYIEGYEMTESLEIIDKLLSLKTDDDLSEKAEPVLSEIKKLVDDFDYITASEKLGIFIKENGADI
ncbi:MAG: response regulator, partial [Oscillospiraceae bacterium]|nr:response regulator [Oscillospiraceae bacterium]